MVYPMQWLKKFNTKADDTNNYYAIYCKVMVNCNTADIEKGK